MASSDGSTQPATKRTSALRLDHASIVTTHLGEAVRFYTEVLGLRLRVQEEDPLRPGRRRALLAGPGGHDVIELIEMPEMAHAAIPGRGALHHLGFRLPEKAWHALRSRLDATGHPYRETQGHLFLRDADGLILEIER